MDTYTGYYYLMISYKNTLENATDQFNKLVGREPDEVIKDHNYWWVGKITAIEMVALDKLGKLRGRKIIEG